MAVGNRLRTAREQQGLSIDDVAGAVRLRPTVLAAIEDEDFDACGGSVYARGHVQVIAGLLGLDPDDLVAEMRVE